MTLEEVQSYINKAIVLQQKSNWTEAIQLVSDVLVDLEDLHQTSIEFAEKYATACLLKASITTNLGNYKDAVDLCHRTLEISTKYKFQRKIGDTNILLGNLHSLSGDFHLSIERYVQSLELYTELGDKDKLSGINTNIGLSYSYLGDYAKSIEYYTSALHIAEEIQNKTLSAMILGNIGLVYAYLADSKKAIEHYSKSLQLNDEIQNLAGKAKVLQNLGVEFKELGEIEKAFSHFSQSLYIRETIGDKKGIASALTNLAMLHNYQHQYDKALEQCFKALSISQELDDKKGIAIANMDIGSIYLFANFDEDSRQKSEEYLLTSMAIFTEIRYKTGLKDNYKLLSDLYKLSQRFEESLTFLQKHIDIDKELTNEEANQKAQLLDHRRKLEQSERDRQIKLARFQEQERLLHDILPSDIANRIIQGETTIAEKNENVSLFFSDIVGFTTISQTIEPDLLVHELNTIFQEYDRIAKQYSIEKIKTIGDAYMAVSGINPAIENPHFNIAMFAIDVIEGLKKLELGRNKFQIRVGLHVGKVVSGVIGGYKFTYDIWGDTVNIASRMESHSEPGRIHVTEAFANAVRHYPEFILTSRGEITVKGKGTMNTYWLEKAK